MENSYDRLRELKAFDETKAGVKGLVDAGISKIPPIFISPPDSFSKASSNIDSTIPVIDLIGVRKDVLGAIREASATWGFFQVVNHGISKDVLDEMLEGVRRFYEQDGEKKKKWYTRDGSKTVVYNSNFDLFSAASANWRDTSYCNMAPITPHPSDLPETCRDIMLEYSKEMKRLGHLLFELLSEALDLKPDHLNELGCSEGHAILSHYYPACPEPEKTLGASKHADYGFLTVLLQDSIGGLQVLYQNQWVDVPPVAGALVVNIGDLLQLISNDKLKSSQHRVVANFAGPRVSVACFFTTGLMPSSKVIGPIKELVSEESPPKYGETTVDMSLRLLKAGKHVLQEKPAAASVAELERAILSYASLKPTPIWAVAENYRFEPAFVEGKKLMAEIGDIINIHVIIEGSMNSSNPYFSSSWRRGFEGGFILDMGVHFISGLRMLVGCEVTSVSALTSHVDSTLPAPDHISSTIQLENGSSGVFVMVVSSKSPKVIWRIVGLKGTLQVERGSKDGKHGYTEVLYMDGGQNKSWFHPFCGVTEELKTFLSDISRANHEKDGSVQVEPRLSFVEGARDVAILDAMLESGKRQGIPVQVKKF